MGRSARQRRNSGFVFALGIGAGALLIGQRVQAAPKPAADQSAEAQLQNAFVAAAAHVGPAVVSISTEQTERVATRYAQPFGQQPFGGQDELYNRFFRDFFGEMPEREFKREGLGSGVIIDQRGYVLTNEHVVGDADKITVTLPDGREFKGEVKGTDPRADLAVVKIDGKNLPYASLGDSTAVQIGQWAIAIGNPFGYVVHSPEPTVTVGVISALHRSLPRTSQRDRDYSDVIQTDAAINPGNSGGPLVNLDGEIIGINVAIFSTSGGYQGIGFAIPANKAREIVGDLIEGKKVLYGWLGIQIQDITQDVAEYYKLSSREGVLVYQVLPDSPAQKGGLQAGDIVTVIDGQPVRNARELVERVGRAKVGAQVTVTALREQKTQTLRVTVGERPSEEQMALGPQQPGAAAQRWRGLQVAPISPDVTRRFQLPPSVAGVVVVDVATGSPADEAGLRVGDVINEINRQPIRSWDEYAAVTARVQGNTLVRTSRGYIVLKGGS